MSFRETIRQYAEEPLTKTVILDLLKDYKRPYDKINELIKQQLLTPVKRGLYVAGPALDITKPEPFLLANHILGPSYISMEAALSYWSPDKKDWVADPGTFEIQVGASSRDIRQSVPLDLKR